MNGPQPICFCGMAHIAGWCLSNSVCSHGAGKAWTTSAVQGFEVCGYCGAGRKSVQVQGQEITGGR